MQDLQNKQRLYYRLTLIIKYILILFNITHIQLLPLAIEYCLLGYFLCIYSFTITLSILFSDIILCNSRTIFCDIIKFNIVLIAKHFKLCDLFVCICHYIILVYNKGFPLLLSIHSNASA